MQLLVGTRKGLFILQRGRQGWRIRNAALLGDPVTMVLRDSNQMLRAAVEHGHFGSKMMVSGDGGHSWEEAPMPSFPPQPEGEQDLDPIRGTPIPWSVQRIWSLECGPLGRTDELWCGTIPGGLFRSDDGGASWVLVDGLWNHPGRKRWFGGGADYPGIHSILVDPGDPLRMLVGVSCGGLWMSADGGSEWRNIGAGLRAAYVPPEQAGDPGIQDPHLIVQCRAAPDHLWMQHHNGIFRSSDGGHHWQEIEQAGPSTFGFSVAVHPAEPETAWFVPAKWDDARYPVDGRLVVTRTRDGGGSFDVLGQGLPRQHAYDLVYRHALAVDAEGRQLAFGSTSGNLWISQDQGDSWQELSSNLPPVYCVRFCES